MLPAFFPFQGKRAKLTLLKLSLASRYRAIEWNSYKRVPFSSLIPELESLIDFVTYCLTYLEKGRRRINVNTMKKRQDSRQEKMVGILYTATNFTVVSYTAEPDTGCNLLNCTYVYPNLWSEKWKRTSFVHRLTSGFDLGTWRRKPAMFCPMFLRLDHLNETWNH